MDLAIGDLVITEDDVQWRVHSITRDGLRRTFVALHVSLPSVLAGDVAHLVWSEAERAWRFRDPGAAT